MKTPARLRGVEVLRGKSVRLLQIARRIAQALGKNVRQRWSGSRDAFNLVGVHEEERAHLLRHLDANANEIGARSGIAP